MLTNESCHFNYERRHLSVRVMSSASSNPLADLWASSLASLLSLTASGQLQFQFQQHQAQMLSNNNNLNIENFSQQNQQQHLTNNMLHHRHDLHSPIIGNNLISEHQQQNIWTGALAGTTSHALTQASSPTVAQIAALNSATEMMLLAQHLTNHNLQQNPHATSQQQTTSNVNSNQPANSNNNDTSTTTTSQHSAPSTTNHFHQHNPQLNHHQLAQQLLQNNLNTLNLNLSNATNLHNRSTTNNHTSSHQHHHQQQSQQHTLCQPLSPLSPPFDQLTLNQLTQSLDINTNVLQLNNNNNHIQMNSHNNITSTNSIILNASKLINSTNNSLQQPATNLSHQPIHLQHQLQAINMQSQPQAPQQLHQQQTQAPPVPSSTLLAKLSAVTSRPNAHVKCVLRLDEKMVDLLESFYAINDNPEPAAIEMIAKRINSCSDLVADWFDTKRIKLNGISSSTTNGGLNGSQNNNNNSDSSPRSPPNRKRAGGRVVTFSEYQRSLLEAIFDENNYLHPQEYEELSNLIEVPARNIKIWFKNRRSKQRLSGRISGA